ncbi:glycosyltransferase [Arthrobacter rhombi]|uniref:glycosyltransferase n=1 Tax=Arthrobacter rhombi TaxID=71253 RepID=UPI003FD5D6EF
MTSAIDHVLLTRFNLPTLGAESTIRAKEGWLRDRVGLFERYCLPSVVTQTNPNFQWIIYFDPASPEWLREYIERWQTDERIHPIFRESVSHEELVNDLAMVTGARGDTLLTTNLDNDDGLASDFVARLQGAAPKNFRAAVYLVNGVIRRDHELYLREDRNNAFCSVREPWEGALGCWADWHNRLGRHMEVEEIAGRPAWLQVIHDSNVSNRVRGRRVDAAGHLSIFGRLLDGIESPSRWSTIQDLVVGRPLRSIRDGFRLVAKRLLFRGLGKNGFDEFKTGLARLRQLRLGNARFQNQRNGGNDV